MGRISDGDPERLLAAFERSGLTQEVFAQEHGVPVSTLRSWIYRRREALAERKLEPRLLPVQVVAAPAPELRGEPAPVELSLASGLTLRFSVGTDARYVAALVAALG